MGQPSHFSVSSAGPCNVITGESRTEGRHPQSRSQRDPFPCGGESGRRDDRDIQPADFLGRDWYCTDDEMDPARRWTSSPTTPGDSPGDHHQTSPSTLPKQLGPPIVSPRQRPPGYWSGPSAPRCPESTACDHRRPAVPLLQTVMTATPAPASRRRTVAPRSPSTRRRAVDSGA